LFISQLNVKMSYVIHYIAKHVLTPNWQRVTNNARDAWTIIKHFLSHLKSLQRFFIIIKYNALSVRSHSILKISSHMKLLVQKLNVKMSFAVSLWKACLTYISLLLMESKRLLVVKNARKSQNLLICSSAIMKMRSSRLLNQCSEKKLLKLASLKRTHRATIIRPSLKLCSTVSPIEMTSKWCKWWARDKVSLHKEVKLLKVELKKIKSNNSKLD